MYYERETLSYCGIDRIRKHMSRKRVRIIKLHV